MRQKTKNRIKSIVTFVLGLVTCYLGIQMSNFINRPIININITSITIREENRGDWKADIKLRMSNSGRTATTTLLKHIQLYFPEYLNRSFSLKIDKSLRINDKSTVEESFSTIFPSVFDTVTMKEIPKLNKIVLEYKPIETDKNYYLTKESENIVYSFGFGFEYHGPENLKGVKIDSVNRTIGLITKQVFIEYKGKLYSNRVYPKTAMVQYKIENDRIYLRYSLSADKIAIGDSSQLIEPFIFLPHPDLKDKIVYPKSLSLRLAIETTEKDRIIYQDYEVDIGEREKTLLYIIK